MKRVALVLTLVSFGAAIAAAQPSTIVGSPHDLSAGGPGPIRAVMEDQVCIFCHTPHNATPIQPLWNRSMPVESYQFYDSPSLDAQPGQPTGTSKMCLSCHDGTISLGMVFSRQTPILMQGGVTVMPDGSSNLGTDLTDDHPVSIRYDAALAAQDVSLIDPSLLPPELRLDANSELQCTTCHDAHDDSRGDFLVMHNFDSQMCNTCHADYNTGGVSGHTCNGCHQPHTSPSGPYLLRGATFSETCMICHDYGPDRGNAPGRGGGHGNKAGGRIMQVPIDMRLDAAKPFVHETHSRVDAPGKVYESTSCASCHESHSMQSGSARAPMIHPNLGKIDGVDTSGSPVAEASYEYEVCFKCHADQRAVAAAVQRLVPDNNVRLQFGAGAVSAHPVTAPGSGLDVPSLRPGWTTASYVACSDCHNSDSGSKAGGIGPDGVHGSSHPTLLIARYDTDDYTTESASAYALCYRCHDRNSILGDESFPEHRTHIVEEDTPCSACHTGHGIASSQGTATGNSHLINFDTAIVFPDAVTGRLEFRDTGRFRGECTLRCHGTSHTAEEYGN